MILGKKIKREKVLERKCVRERERERESVGERGILNMRH